MLETVRLICDSGLLVLIWMVQLIVYPSFSYYKVSDLYQWHDTYTQRIAVIVIPLMFGQLITTGIQVLLQQNFYTVSSSALLLLVWLSTFLQFVPLHSNISKKWEVEKAIKGLILKNWIRTILWSLLFILSCYSTFKS
jgi:hypothetical protein